MEKIVNSVYLFQQGDMEVNNAINWLGKNDLNPENVFF